MGQGRRQTERITSKQAGSERQAANDQERESTVLQEGGGAEVEPGEGTEGQVHVGPMRQEPTRAGRTRQQGCEGTLGRPL